MSASLTHRPIKTPAGQRWISYYFLGGQRIAMRERTASQNVLHYLLSDHLGSTSVVTDGQGNPEPPRRCRPFDASQGTPGAPGAVDRWFTGQRSEEVQLGALYDYGARFYSPRLGRFISPDAIVPDPGNPQALNRYSYVMNRPLSFTDPSGHAQVSDIADGWGGGLAYAAGLALSAKLDEGLSRAWVWLTGLVSSPATPLLVEDAARLGSSMQQGAGEVNNGTGPGQMRPDDPSKTREKACVEELKRCADRLIIPITGQLAATEHKRILAARSTISGKES